MLHVKYTETSYNHVGGRGSSMRVLIVFLFVGNFLFLQAETAFVAEPTNDIEAFDDSFEDEFDAPKVAEKGFDPLSGYNTIMTGFNDKFYTGLLIPTAKGYRHILPKEGRKSVSNFFDNLLFPVRFVNNVLQLKFQNAGEEFARFGINSTIGLLGLFDPAKSKFDLNAHHEDFGQTLGHYGVGSGFHIVLPFLGPSNLRDTIGLFADTTVDPLYKYEGRFYNITQKNYESIALKSYDILNDSSLHIGEYASLKKDALVLYPFLRDLYEQRRVKLIKE